MEAFHGNPKPLALQSSGPGPPDDFVNQIVGKKSTFFLLAARVIIVSALFEEAVCLEKLDLHFDEALAFQVLFAL